jgi:hypothetical protein
MTEGRDEPIDFSPLDPTCDARSWQTLVDGAIAKATRAAEERETVWDLISARWHGVAAGAAIAAAAGIIALVRPLPPAPRYAPAAAGLLSPGATDEMLLLGPTRGMQ